jgi:hypothetical protein
MAACFGTADAGHKLGLVMKRYSSRPHAREFHRRDLTELWTAITVTPGVPTDADVHKLLHASGMSKDPRSFVAVALLLSEMLPVGRLNRLEWANWDRSGKTLITRAAMDATGSSLSQT